MFDWVGDAIDWIGDGISSLWDNTVGVVTSEAARVIFDMMFDWLFMLIYDGIAALFYAIDQSTADLFELGWIQAFVILFYNIGWILFITGMVVAVFDTAIAYESGQANIKDTCLNVLKGFFACSLFTVVPQRLYSFCVALQNTFAIDLVGAMIQGRTATVALQNTFAIDLVGAMIQGRTATLTSAGLDALDAFRSDVSLSSLFFIILFGYCTIKVVFANIKRGGILLCQIAVGSLYMFSVPRGYTDGFVNWCKQVIATCLTAFLQTTRKLVQAGHSYLPHSFPADNNIIPRTADLSRSPDTGGRYMLIR